jgi:hypothetical protein
MRYLKIYENFNQEQSLEEKLLSFGIPLSEWGKGSAKNIKHLQKEIDDKETVLKEIDGELIRFVSVVAVAVENNGKRLVEDRQEFNDGRVRRRGTKRCGEKCIAGETSEQSAIRCLEEELGLDVVDTSKLIFEKTHEKTKMSMSYPGLKATYSTALYTYNMPDEQFKPDGYIEEQDDKKTYFIWE